jgi:hypothetical protein
MDLVQQRLGARNVLQDVIKHYRIERLCRKRQAAIFDQVRIKAAAPAVIDRMRVYVSTNSVRPELEHIAETAADVQGSA